MNLPTGFRALAPILLAICLAAPPAALAAPPAGFTFAVSPDTLRANEDGLWELNMRVVNLTGLGVYGDSMLLVVTPEGGRPGEPGTITRPLPMAAMSKDVSAGDSAITRISVSAAAARARIELRLYAHSSASGPFVASGVVVAAGSVLEERYPALLARVGAQAVEMVKVPAPAGEANGAGVLLLPGEGSDALAMLVPASRLASQGVSVVIVNAPGRGRSQGPDDFAGPASRAAALAGLDTLRRLPGVERTRIGAWGISRGATLALSLALEKPAPFAAVAAQGACYDLWSAWRAAPGDGRAAIEAAAGRDSAAWRARSPLLRAPLAKDPGVAVLVQHGERDEVFPAAAAHAFADAMQAAGGTVLPRFLPTAGHELPVAEPLRFLRSRLSAPH